MNNLICILTVLLLLHISYIWSCSHPTCFENGFRASKSATRYFIYIVYIGVLIYLLYTGGSESANELYKDAYNIFFPICNRHPFFTNLIATIAALIIAFGLICPRIKIKKNLVKVKDDEYKLSFKNTGLMHCSDVEIGIYGYKKNENERVREELESPEKLMQMGGIFFRDNRQISKGVVINNLTQYDSIELSIKATHPISNITKVFTHSYNCGVIADTPQNPNTIKWSFSSLQEACSTGRHILIILLILTFCIYHFANIAYAPIVNSFFRAQIIGLLTTELYWLISNFIHDKNAKTRCILIVTTSFLAMALLTIITIAVCK